MSRFRNWLIYLDCILHPSEHDSPFDRTRPRHGRMANPSWPSMSALPTKGTCVPVQLVPSRHKLDVVQHPRTKARSETHRTACAVPKHLRKHRGGPTHIDASPCVRRSVHFVRARPRWIRGVEARRSRLRECRSVSTRRAKARPEPAQCAQRALCATRRSPLPAGSRAGTGAETHAVNSIGEGASRLLRQWKRLKASKHRSVQRRCVR